MENKDINQNIKLGAFVLAGLALFLFAVFYIGSENNIFNRTFTITTVFKSVEGLKEGDNVWLSGVKIGTVKDVRIVSEGKVLVTLSLRNKQNEFIRRDATASIGSDGLVGSKIVVIRPGTSSQVINEEDTIKAVSPADTQELINIAKEVGENTRTITLDFKLIAEKINKGQGIVGELLNEGNLAQDLRKTISALKTTSNNTARLTADLSTIVKEMEHGDGLLPTLINDTTYAADFAQALANVKKVSNNASAIAGDLEAAVAKINNQENAVGVILSDTTFANKLQHTMNNAERASQKLDENMEALQHNFLLRGFFRKKAKREAKSTESQGTGLAENTEPKAHSEN
jgi:phospholipid/cholesterol/gamma-HCH transport system substrate-binding protein